MNEPTRHRRTPARQPGRRAVILATLLSAAAALPDSAAASSQNRTASSRPLTAPTGMTPDPVPAQIAAPAQPAPPVEPAQSVEADPATLPAPSAQPAPSVGGMPDRRLLPSRADVMKAFGGRTPTYWGLEAPGTLTRLGTGTQGIAVTVDFCGGTNGSDFDQRLLSALKERHVPATLFLNSRWIAANPSIARQLAAEPLFELANHGTKHQPLSTTGKSAYGIPGTRDAGEVYDEVMTNDAVLTQLTGTRPRFFRPGTAFLDDIAVQIIGALGLTPAGFSINADGGATYPAATVAREAAKARPGDVIICHGNHPRGGTAEGMGRALDAIATGGTPFIRLP